MYYLSTEYKFVFVPSYKNIKPNLPRGRKNIFFLSMKYKYVIFLIGDIFQVI